MTYMGVDGLCAEDIRQVQEDLVLWIVDSWGGDVTVYTAEFLPFTRSESNNIQNELASIDRVEPSGVPSCLTPKN